MSQTRYHRNRIRELSLFLAFYKGRMRKEVEDKIVGLILKHNAELQEEQEKDRDTFEALLRRYEERATRTARAPLRKKDLANLLLEPFDGDHEAARAAIEGEDVMYTAEGWPIEPGAIAWALEILAERA